MFPKKHFAHATKESREFRHFASDLEEFCDERVGSYRSETEDIRRFLNSFDVPRFFKSGQPTNDFVQQRKTE